MTSLSHISDPLFRPLDQSWRSLLARRAELLLALWCVFLFAYGLTATEFYRTESLRAVIAQGMLRGGDWIVPRLYGEPLFTKPPGMYLAIVLCSLPFGRVTEFSARLPSALAASVSVILFYRLFRGYVGRTGALLAAGILPMSLIYLDKTCAAEIDMMLVAWVIGAVYCFMRILENDEITSDSLSPVAPRLSLGWWLGVELCLAGGVLTKWTAPAFFYTMAVPLLWWRGRLRLLWSWQHLLAAAIGAMVCVSWIAAAVAVTGWDVFYTTILREAFPRLLPFYDRHYHQHHSYWVEAVRHPFWVLATSVPTSLVALWSLRPGFFRLWDERGRLLVMVLHCWAWPNLLFWTLVSDHKPRHSFPLIPGVAGLAAMVVLAWCQGKLSLPWRGLTPKRLIAGALVLWLVVKVVYVEAIMPARAARAAPRDKGQLLASLVPFGLPLYILRLKDEGIMFYFGGEVIRLQSLADLPSHAEPMYCILNDSEWRQLRHGRAVEVVHHLQDEQGQPIVLVRIN